MFRGREMVHAERGLAILERLSGELTELGTVESPPKLEGRNMFMLLTPIKKEPVKGEKHDEADVEAEEKTEATPE